MIDWIKTAQAVGAILAALVAIMVAWWNLGLPRAVFSPEAPIPAGPSSAARTTAVRHRGYPGERGLGLHRRDL
jgi:hypothetical protein